MKVKRLLNPSRVRKIGGSFSWIEHRFITAGFIHELSTIELLLYFFLITVSDRNGISFYRDDRICSLLKIGLSCLAEARNALSMSSLLAYEPPIYQVLSLPSQPVAVPSKEQIIQQQRQMARQQIKKIKEQLK